MTSLISLQPLSSGSRRRLGLLCVLGLLTTTATTLYAGPVKHQIDEGVIDWSLAEVRAVGVGTPRVLSPTGGVTDESLQEAARRNVERRLVKMVETLRWNQRERLSQHPVWLRRAREATRQLRTMAIRRASDGTIHYHAALSFEQFLKQGRPRLDGRTKPTVTVVIQLEETIHPCLQISLQNETFETPVVVGLSLDTSAPSRPLRWLYGASLPEPKKDQLVLKGVPVRRPNEDVSLAVSASPEVMTLYRSQGETADYVILLPEPETKVIAQ